MIVAVKASENNMGKEENAGNQHFLLFPYCFPTFQRQLRAVETYLIFDLQNAFDKYKS